MNSIKIKSFTSFIAITFSLCVMNYAVTAQDISITPDDVTHMLEEMQLQEAALYRAEGGVLKKEQRRAIADQIMYHYTPETTFKYKHLIMDPSGQTLPITTNTYNRAGHAALLQQSNKVREILPQFKVRSLDIKGQKAAAEVTLLYNYQIKADSYKDPIQFAVDAVTKADCHMDLEIGYVGTPRITNENCTARTRLTNLQIEKKQAGTPPLKLSDFIVLKK